MILEVSHRVGSDGWWYYGRLSVEEIRESAFEGVRFMGSHRTDDQGNKEAQEVIRYRAGIIDDGPFKRGCYFAPFMQRFAVMTQDGQIIVTDDSLAKLMTLYPGTYHLDNVEFLFSIKNESI